MRLIFTLIIVFGSSGICQARNKHDVNTSQIVITADSVSTVDSWIYGKYIVPDTIVVPTSDRSHQYHPSAILQLGMGSIAHAVVFWGVGGKHYIQTGDRYVHAPLLGAIASGIAIAAVGNEFCKCDGSYVAAIGGSAVGILFGAPLYRYVADHNPGNYLLPYLALSLPSVILSVLLYQISLSDEDYQNTNQSQYFLIYPEVLHSSFGVGIQVKY